MVSIEAYRAAIGRFNGKAKKSSKFQTIPPTEITMFLFLMTLLLVIIYGLSIAFIFSGLFMNLMMTYGYILTIICFSTDLLAISFQKMAITERVFRKTSLPSGVKVHTLIRGRYLDTFVLDGRDGKSDPETDERDTEIDVKLCSTENNSIKSIDSGKIYKMFVNAVHNTILFGIMLLTVNLIFHVSKNGNRLGNYSNHATNTTSCLERYCLNHLKLGQLLIDGDVESNPGPVNNNVETSKGKGRPKKVKQVKGFAKRKLTFDNSENNKPINLINENNNEISLHNEIEPMETVVITDINIDSENNEVPTSSTNRDDVAETVDDSTQNEHITANEIESFTPVSYTHLTLPTKA